MTKKVDDTKFVAAIATCKDKVLLANSASQRTPSAGAGLAQPKGINMRQEVFTLAEGDVTIQWPESISEESFEDFNDWIAILLRKLKRNVRPVNSEIENRASERGPSNLL